MVDAPRNILQINRVQYPSLHRSWWQKPRHTLLGLALESACPWKHRGLCATLRRVTPTNLTAGPLHASFHACPDPLNKKKDVMPILMIVVKDKIIKCFTIVKNKA